MCPGLPFSLFPAITVAAAATATTSVVTTTSIIRITRINTNNIIVLTLPPLLVLFLLLLLPPPSPQHRCMHIVSVLCFSFHHIRMNSSSPQARPHLATYMKPLRSRWPADTGLIICMQYTTVLEVAFSKHHPLRGGVRCGPQVP